MHQWRWLRPQAQVARLVNLQSSAPTLATMAATTMAGPQQDSTVDFTPTPVVSPAPKGVLSSLPSEVLTDIFEHSQKKQHGVSLRYLLDFGTQPLARQMLLSARFLHTELPTRLAHRIAELNNLPPELSQNVHVERVKRWYAASFVDMRSFPPVKDESDVAAFTQMLKNAYARHNAVVPAIAKGVEEYKRVLQANGMAEEEMGDLHAFLDSFFLSRTALRFLAGHHVALFEQAKRGPEAHRADRIGLIHTKCSPLQVVHDAVSDARDVCIRVRGDAPEVVVHGSPTLTFPYVPSHLHHMVFELIKNSLRAVAETWDKVPDAHPPDIKVVVAQGREDITIKISDQGGGIPRSGLAKMWTYLYTTSTSPLPDVDPNDDTYSGLPAVLAGYGCGLPLARMYARYFGGDIQLFSMQGYGTDAFLHLSRLGNTEEPLPGQK